jgi:superfamily II DNA/RNA helicase
MMKEPKLISVSRRGNTAVTIEQTAYPVAANSKMVLLLDLLERENFERVLVFTRTKRGADRLAHVLEARSHSSNRIHGDRSQSQREAALRGFKSGKTRVLVATDVAARGIDVDDVQVVFNYDLPYDGEDYIHRIGRTGRAGRSGRAISFVAGRELFQVQQIERYTKTKIHRGRPPTQNEVEEARATVMVEKLRATLQSGEFKRQDHLVERLLERLRLHDIGVNVRPVCEGSDACVDSVLVDVDEKIQAVATSGLIAKGDHLAELPRGVDVKKREGRRRGIKRFQRQVQHHRAVLANRIHHDRPLALGNHLAKDVDTLGLQPLQVRQALHTVSRRINGHDAWQRA